MAIAIDLDWKFLIAGKSTRACGARLYIMQRASADWIEPGNLAYQRKDAMSWSDYQRLSLARKARYGTSLGDTGGQARVYATEVDLLFDAGATL